VLRGKKKLDETICDFPRKSYVANPIAESTMIGRRLCQSARQAGQMNLEEQRWGMTM
jgi:hypothetical protein